MTEQKATSRLAQYLPILQWLPSYDRTWLRADVMAGLTIVALLVPEGMAYAQLAGMPPESAFYIAPVGLVLYALFGTSRQLVVASSSALAVMSAATISGLAVVGSSEYIALTSMLALVTGIITIVLGLLKLGRIANFFSESVLTGFVIGLALVIAIKQVPKIFGIEGGGEDFFERVWEIIIHLPTTQLPTLLVGISTVALMWIIERRFHRIPAAMVALIYGILVSSIFGLEGRGVEIVGAIPGGLALPKLPEVPLRDVGMLVTGAFALALVSFAESIGPAQNFARKHGYTVDPNAELIGLGVANVGAGLFRGFPIGSSLSKTAANDAAGAKTQMAALIAAVLAIVVALFLTPLFYTLPEATLGAIVVVAISGMLNFGEIGRLWRLRRIDFALAVVALFGVLIFDVLPGLAIAVVLSLLILVYQTSKPAFSVLGRLPDRLTYADRALNKDVKIIPGVLIVRPNQAIYFANASTLRHSLVNLVETADPPVHAMILDLGLTGELDVPGMDMLSELREELAHRHTRLLLAEVHAPVRALLEKNGVAQEIGKENIRSGVFGAVIEVIGADNQDGLTQELDMLAEMTQSMAKMVGDWELVVDGAEHPRLDEIRHRLDDLAVALRFQTSNSTDVELPGVQQGDKV